MNIKFENVFLENSAVIVGKLEGDGPLKNFFDSIDECYDSSFENSEINILKKAIDILFEKYGYSNDDIDVAIGGELSNQLTTTSYTFRSLKIPLLGIYAACSTITLGLGLAAITLQNSQINRCLVFTSSHNQSAERQFRNPVEYGGNKEETQTFTATVGAAATISKNSTAIKISNFCIGKVIDIGYKNSLDFGRVMAPAAIETLLYFFRKTATKPLDYDLILTGDLSSHGQKIVKKALEEEFGSAGNYDDCGLILYNIKKQKVLAGGSGPGTSAAVLFSYVKNKLETKVYKKVILCATGALMNPTMTNQKNSIPAIAHLIVLEAEQ